MQKSSLEIESTCDLDLINSMKEKNQKTNKTNYNKKFWTKSSGKQNENSKTKIILEFKPSVACGIKSLATKRFKKVKPTTRMFNGKMFAKLSLMSFIYDVIEMFYFPNKLWKK